jgi:hypothetical protein
MVLIDQGDRASIVWKIETAERRYIREAVARRLAATGVEKTAVSFSPAEGPAAIKHGSEVFASLIYTGLPIVDTLWALRHDLSPEETSQIAGVVGRDVSVGDHKIFPGVVVDVHESRTPGPTTHFYGGRAALVIKLPVSLIMQKSVSAGELL